MIWSAGEILPDDGLSIDAADRTFEHGLGLFETMRTWDGRATLLGRHRSRMLFSAEVLGLTIDPVDFPDEVAVERLLEAEPKKGERVLRVTATGGRAGGKSVVWMRSSPLIPRDESQGLRVRIGAWTVASADPMARHKALNYWSRRMAFEAAQAREFHESLGRREDGALLEGSRSNLFAIHGDEVITPSLSCPIVPGVMRGLVMELAGSIGMKVREVDGLSVEQLEAADEVFLTNAVRGIMRIEGGQEADTGRWVELPRSGDRMGRLKAVVDDHLHLGRI